MTSARSATPLHQTLRERIHAELVTPLRATGGRLPPVRALAERFGANAGTVNRALHDLVAAGYLEQRVGSGTYVRVDNSTAQRFIGLYYVGSIVDERPDTRIFGVLDQRLQEGLTAANLPYRHYVDLRLGPDRLTPLPSLVEDAKNGRISCVVIVRRRPGGGDNWLRELPVPLIDHHDDLGHGCAHVDLREGAALAAEALLAAGCRRLDLIGPIADELTYPELARRYNGPLRNGLAEVLRTRGLPVPKARGLEDLPQPWNHPGTHIDLGRVLLQHLCGPEAGPGAPDGLILFPDVLAVGAVQAAAALHPYRRPRMAVLACRENQLPGLESCIHVENSMADVAQAMVTICRNAVTGRSAGELRIGFRLAR